MPEYNEYNCRKLAEEIANRMDTKDLIGFVHESLATFYGEYPDGFFRDWDNYEMREDEDD